MSILCPMPLLDQGEYCLYISTLNHSPLSFKQKNGGENFNDK